MIKPAYGNPCAMDAIVDICKRRNLILIEDCCEALGAYYDGRAVGKFGRVGTFSFYFSHHMTTLEGGITVTDDFELAEPDAHPACPWLGARGQGPRPLAQEVSRVSIRASCS